MRLFRNLMLLLLLVTLMLPQVAGAGPFDGGSAVGILVIVLAVMVLVFFIAREILCWYWKINTIVSLLEDIKGKLGNVGSVLNAQNIRPNPPNSPDETSGAYKVKCKTCGEKTSSSGKFCEFCGAPMAV